MAYVSQEDKKELSVGIKKVLKKYNVKGTIGVHNHSTIVVRLRSGDLDILGNYWNVYMILIYINIIISILEIIFYSEK